jgi:hypothetical protein
MHASGARTAPGDFNGGAIPDGNDSTMASGAGQQSVVGSDEIHLLRPMGRMTGEIARANMRVLGEAFVRNEAKKGILYEDASFSRRWTL